MSAAEVHTERMAPPVWITPRLPTGLQLVYAHDDVIRIRVSAALEGVVWDGPTAAEFARRRIPGGLAAIPATSHSIVALPGAYLWTLEDPTRSDDGYLHIMPRVPRTAILEYPPDDDYSEGRGDDGHATATIDVHASGVCGLVWSERALIAMIGRGVVVHFLAEPPDYVTIGSKAPGCTILNGVVVCYQ